MSRVYCGNPPHDVREKEVDDMFYKYGKIRDIHIVRKERSAFAFVEYSDYRDAEDAVYGRDGYRFDGERLKVELSKERRRDRDRERDGDRGRDRGREKKERPKREKRERRPPPRSDFGVNVKGLPEGSKWRNLKEHFATAGTVIFCDIKEGEGVVEFEKEEDMLEAIKKFDDTEYENVKISCEEAPKKPQAEVKPDSEKPAEGNDNNVEVDAEKPADVEEASKQEEG